MRTWKTSLAFWLVLSTAGLAAETDAKKAPSDSAESQSSATVSLRVWKDSIASKKSVRILIQPKGRKSVGTVDLHLPGEGFTFNEYVELPVGSITVSLFDDESPKTKILSMPLTLVPGSFSTLLVRENAGRMTAELLDDTPPNASLNIGELTVRNFVGDIVRLQIRLDADTSLRLNSPESFVHIRGLERKAWLIETSGAQKSGKTVQWKTELDFQKNRRATLLIFPDSYGRVRPRVTIDGESSAVAAEEAP